MAYRRAYGRRYRRRAVSRVRTVTGKSASFIKLPSYKNMAYRGNERSGVLHEIKFVKQVPLDFEVSGNTPYNYAFLYIDCMAELINSQDFLKYAAQFQDYCPYAVTVSAACPVSLVGNSLLTNRLYDWPYFSTTPGRELNNFNSMSLSNAQLGQYLINAGQFYPVGSLPQSADYPITLETFDSFFASHSTSKKLWNANIPYGVRYARYYATSAQKAQIKNILQDAIVRYEYNDLPDVIAANVQSDVGSVNLLFRNQNGNIICMGNPVRKSVEIWGREHNLQGAEIYPVRQNDIDSDTQTRNFAIYSYLWSLQRSRQGQFNPFYYVGVNLNQTHLSSDNLGKQVLTLTFKFYVYFKNEITDFFQGVTGSASGGEATSTKTTKIISTTDESGVQSGTLAQQALLQRSITNFRANRQFLNYVSNSLANQLVQLTIPEIYRQGLQHTFIGNYLLSYYRDDPTIYGANRNGFVIDESCYDSSLNKYVFQGYIDLNPTATSTYLQLNKYEPEPENTDSKFITNYGQTNYSTTMSSTMQELNVEHTCPQWSQVIESDSLNTLVSVPITSTYQVAPVCYSSTNFSEYSGQYYYKLFEALGNSLAKSLDIYTILTNIQSMDPYLFSSIATAPIRVLNLAAIYDYTQNVYKCQYCEDYGRTFKFTTHQGGSNLQPDFTYATQNSYVQGLNQYFVDGLTSVEPGVPAATLAEINNMLADIPNNNTIASVQQAQSTLFICVNCPMSNFNIIGSYNQQATWSTDSTGQHRYDGYIYPMLSLIIPSNVYNNSQIVLFQQLIKDFLVQSQSMLINSMVMGYDPTAIDLSTTEFFTNFIQYSSLSVYQQYGWYIEDVKYQQALTQAQNTFQQSLPVSAGKVWKKVKGFLSKAWSAVKKVGKGLIKVVGGTAAAAYLPGGSAVASALIPSGIKDVTSEISALVLSGKKKTQHYVDGRLAGITKSSSTGLVKCLITPGVCPLTSAQPVNLDSNQFVDQGTYEISSIDIGDYSESRLQTIRFKHDFSSLPRYTYITGDGEEVEGSFVQTRLKVQVYMDKPSEDFILPTTFIGVGVNNYYTEESTA